MSMKVSRDAYQKLVDEDLAWLNSQPRTLEREHVKLIVAESVRWEYPTDEMIEAGAGALRDFHWGSGDTGDFYKNQVRAIFEAIHGIGRASP